MTLDRLDLTADEFAALAAMRSPDVVYHLSWLAPGRGAAAQAGRAVQSVLAVLEAARLQGAKVVTALPGAALYGDVPLRDLPIKEGHAWNPVGLHGIVAKAVVDMLNLYRADHTVEFTALAMSTVYGPRQRPDGGVVAHGLAEYDAADCTKLLGRKNSEQAALLGYAPRSAVVHRDQMELL